MNRPTVVRLVLALGPWLLLTGCPAPPPPVADAPPGGGETAGTQARVYTGGETQWGPADGIPLGGYMSLTADYASYGRSSNKAFGLAIDEINAAGGVNGRPLTLYVEDSASKQEETVNAVKRLLDTRKVCVVIGEVASSLSLAAAPICQTAGVPMLSPSSTNPTLTSKGDMIFRSCFTDDQQGAYVASFALSKGWRKAVLLRDISSDYSKGQAKVIQERFLAGGGQILADEGYQQKQQDFSAELTKIKPLNPDVIFIPGYYTEAGLIIKQARELGLTCALVGADGWDSPVLQEIAGDLLNTGCYFVNHYSKDEQRPKVQQFVEAFRARYNEAPDSLAACAYDAVYVVAEALRRAGSTEPAALRDALAATKDFDGVTGTITIDAQRNASKPCVVLTFKDGVQQIETTITPADI